MTEEAVEDPEAPNSSASYEQVGIPVDDDENEESDDWYDEEEEVLVYGGLDSMLVEDLFEEPILEPDPFDDLPEKFEEVAGEEFSLVEEEHPVPDHALTDEVRALLGTLKAHERVVVELHFGIGEDDSYSTEEIAEHFDLDEEQVAAILARAIVRLRRAR